MNQEFRIEATNLFLILFNLIYQEEFKEFLKNIHLEKNSFPKIIEKNKEMLRRYSKNEEVIQFSLEKFYCEEDLDDLLITFQDIINKS
jgi:hypothetical protein